MHREPPIIAVSDGVLDLWQDRLTGFVLATTIVILPLILIPAGYDPFRFPKVLVVRAAAIVMLTICAARLIWSGDANTWRWILQDRLFQIAAFIAAWCALSVVLSPQPFVSIWAWGDVIAGLTLFFGARFHSKRTGSKLVLSLVVVAAIIVSTVVLLQTLDVWHPLVNAKELHRLSTADQILLRKAALLGNRNDVGVYLLIPLAVATALVVKHPVLAAIGTLTVMSGIILSNTMTAIVLGVGIVGIQTIWWIRHLHRRKFVAVAALLILGVALALLLLTQTAVKERFIRYQSALQTGRVLQNLGGRGLSFSVAGELVTQKPLLGVGPGRFPMEFTNPAIVLRSRNPELIGDLGHTVEGTYFDMVHNDYLEIAAEAGLPALFASLAFAAFYLRILIVKTNSESQLLTAASSGTLSVLAISGAALVQFPLQIAVVYGTLALVAGTSLGYVERFEK